MLKICIVFSIAFFIQGCVYTFGNTSVEFSQKWDQSKTQSSFAWLYKGEDDHHYYVVEQKPGENTRYKLSKKKFVLKGVQPMDACTLCKGIDLKPEDIQILSPNK